MGVAKSMHFLIAQGRLAELRTRKRLVWALLRSGGGGGRKR